MNKAEKRVVEVTAVETIYTHTLALADAHENDAHEYRQKLSEIDSDNQYDMEYWQRQVDRAEVMTEAYRKISEALLKMM